MCWGFKSWGFDQLSKVNQLKLKQKQKFISIKLLTEKFKLIFLLFFLISKKNRIFKHKKHLFII